MFSSNLLVELSPEEQQLSSGGCYHFQPCFRPKKRCCDYQKNDRHTPSDMDDSYPDSGDMERD
jgi:hypothetical protein